VIVVVDVVVDGDGDGDGNEDPPLLAAEAPGVDPPPR
jgi:hypothetical protein